MRKKKFFDSAEAFVRSIAREHIGLYAAEASFFLIISFVPLLMLLVTLLQFVIPLQKEELFSVLDLYLPENMELFLSGILDELFSKKAISIISLSSLVLLWRASRGGHSVIGGLHHIFRTPGTIYYKERLRSLFFTLALILTVLSTLIVLVFGNALWSLLSRAFPLLNAAGSVVTLLKYTVSALLITLFALLLYCSNAKKPFSALRAQFPGALFTAAGWILFSTGFSIYITNFSNYSYLYGSLAALILLMLWLYICMWLLFLGGKINHLLYQRRISGEGEQ